MLGAEGSVADVAGGGQLQAVVLVSAPHLQLAGVLRGIMLSASFSHLTCSSP